MKRVKANDPAAMTEMGTKHHEKGDYDVAIKYFTKAAELGDLVAHYYLGLVYEGEGREGVERNEKKMMHHYEKAAVGGHIEARFNLGRYELYENGSIERAVKHFIIAANLGCDLSMKALWVAFKTGDITKEDLEAAIRAHKAAVDATKSQQREAAEAAEAARKS